MSKRVRERERERERGREGGRGGGGEGEIEPNTDKCAVCVDHISTESDFSSTYHCVEEEGLEVVMETGVYHTTIIVEQKYIFNIKLVVLRKKGINR